MTGREQNVIGRRVCAQRTELGLTQDELASACQRLGWDMARSTLAKIETGIRAVTDGEVVVLAAALQCTPGKLLDMVPVKKALNAARQGTTEKE